MLYEDINIYSTKKCMLWYRRERSLDVSSPSILTIRCSESDLKTDTSRFGNGAVLKKWFSILGDILLPCQEFDID